MKPLLLFLFLSTAACGQDKDYDRMLQDFIQHEKEIERRNTKAQDKTDTVPVTILVRISGRPWAFFHDGWEVRKVSEDPGKYLPMQEPCDIPGCAVYHPFVLRPGKTYSHLLYLDSKKRPIRKEWVVYQTFKR